MEIDQLLSGTIAHAYIFYRSDAPGVLLVLEKKHGITFGASHNALLYDVEQFGIEDSRTVTELGNLHGEGETYIAIVARSLTIEAQHALLKTFEEPRSGVHYLLFIDQPDMLLPTLRSRCIVSRRLGDASAPREKNKHPDFLTLTLTERFAYIEKISKSLKKDDPHAFRDAALLICDSVIADLAYTLPDTKSKNNSQIKDSKTTSEVLSRILVLRSYLHDRGSSAKQLLEATAMQIELLARK